MDVYTYAGINPRGRDAGGQRADVLDAAELAQMLFAQGWREAKIRRAGETEPIGAVERHPENGQRTWWGEFAPGR